MSITIKVPPGGSIVQHCLR